MYSFYHLTHIRFINVYVALPKEKNNVYATKVVLQHIFVARKQKAYVRVSIGYKRIKKILPSLYVAIGSLQHVFVAEKQIGICVTRLQINLAPVYCRKAKRHMCYEIYKPTGLQPNG